MRQSAAIMDVERFWALLKPGEDAEEPADSLREQLELLEPEEIAAFQQHFDQHFHRAYRWSLWGAAYIIEGGCSDDGFIDFRYALISKGKRVYENALADADSLVDVDIVSDELFGYVAGDIYKEKTGRVMPRQPLDSPSTPAGDDWDFEDNDENVRRFPRITKRFSG